MSIVVKCPIIKMSLKIYSYNSNKKNIFFIRNQNNERINLSKLILKGNLNAWEKFVLDMMLT